MRSSLQLDHELRSAVNQAILGAIPDILIRIGLDGAVREVIQPRGQELLEPDAGWEGFTNRPEGQPWMARIQACIQESKVISDKFSIHRGDKSQHFEIRLTPNGPEEALALLRDITIQVHAQDKLARQENLLLRLSQTLPTLMFLFQRATNQFQWVNQSLAEKLEYPETNDLHQLLSWLHPEDCRNVPLWLSQIANLEDGDVLEREIRVLHKQNSYRIFRCRLVVFERDAKGIASVCGMLEDITDSRRTQEQFQRAALLQAAGRLTGILAHEFNNSLTIINNLSELLLEQLPPGQSRLDAQEIKKVTDQAIHLTRRLQNQSAPHVLGGALDISDQLQNFLPFLARLLPGGTRVVHSIIHQGLVVSIDIGDFEQLLGALVMNLQYGSEVEIRLESSVGRLELGRPLGMAVDQHLARIRVVGRQLSSTAWVGRRPVPSVGVSSIRRIATSARGWFETSHAEDGSLVLQVVLPCVGSQGAQLRSP